jgi:periplasmic divalent cation tolerance protein
MNTYLIVSTCPVDQASQLANQIVSEGHAACVNLIPKVQSIYRWQGKICQDEESLMLIKTAAHSSQSCIQFLKSIHPYDVPEIISISLDVEHSNQDYLEWVHSMCTTQSKT